MTEYELESLPSAQLFQLCAEHLDEGRCWEEFVKRYNDLLVRAVNRTYRRFASTESFSKQCEAETGGDLRASHSCASPAEPITGKDEMRRRAAPIGMSETVSTG